MAITVSQVPENERAKLTKREEEVLMAWLMAQSKAIAAQQLGVAEDTVRSHIAHIRHKYEALNRSAHTKADLLMRAIEDGRIKAG